jgi:hypothetical protein
VHIHAPDGAQKKDGSTDSLTISSALISLGIFCIIYSLKQISKKRSWIDRRTNFAWKSFKNIWNQGKSSCCQKIKTERSNSAI